MVSGSGSEMFWRQDEIAWSLVVGKEGKQGHKGKCLIHSTLALAIIYEAKTKTQTTMEDSS